MQSSDRRDEEGNKEGKTEGSLSFSNYMTVLEFYASKEEEGKSVLLIQLGF